MRNSKGHAGKAAAKRQAGFTLVELLVVVGIIVGLAAVIIPNVGRFSGKGTEGATVSEKENVQAAFDSMMAEKGITTVTGRVAGTDARVQDWSSLPAGTGAVALSSYLRASTTTYYYCYTDAGLVTQHTAAGTC